MDEDRVTVQDSVVLALAVLSVSLAVLVWIVNGREMLTEEYTDSDEV